MNKKEFISLSIALLLLTASTFLYILNHKNTPQNLSSKVNSNDFSSEFTANVSRNPNALYDIYVSLSGNLGYLQIDSIENNTIEYNLLKYYPLKNKLTPINDLSVTQDNVVLCALENISIQSNVKKSVTPVKEGVLGTDLNIDLIRPIDRLISDPNRKTTYMSLYPSTKGIDPDGAPIPVLSNVDNKVLDKTLYVKGMLDGYDIKDGYLYLNISNAAKCDYTEVPDNYILKVNRDTFSSEILTKAGTNLRCVDLKLNSQNKIYLVGGTDKSENNCKLSIYDIKGTHLKDIAIDLWATNIQIDSNDIAYISHRDKNNIVDQLGETITIVDTKNDKIIGKLTGFKGPTEMTIKDSYLFVTNTEAGTISVIDTNERKVIGTISLGQKSYPYDIVVLKNK